MMKKFLILCVLGMTGSLVLNAQEETLQSKILTAFQASMRADDSQLDAIIAELKKETLDHTNTYWLAYALQQNCIVYMSKNDMDKAEVEINESIKQLESISELDSEDHALFGSVLGLSITFSPLSAMGLSSKSGKHYEKALKKDANNMRAFLGIGKGDFFTPVMFGGGKKVEQNLQKALSLPAQSSDDPNAPSWGRDEAYMFLAQYYEREDRNSEAMLMCKKGLKEFPKHGGITQVMERLNQGVSEK